MKIFKNLLMIILLHIGGISSQCNEGCLKCNQNNQCLLCEYTKSYRLINNTCVLSQIDNCETYSTDGLCLTCKPQYYLVLGQTNTCLAIPSQVANCSYYSGPSTCSSCLPGYYIKGTTCEGSTTLISNCLEYSGDSICLTCQDNYLIGVENKTCHLIVSKSNCKRYSDIRCLSCDNTTFLQNDYVRHNIHFFMKEDPKGASSYVFYLVNKQNIDNKCRRIQVENCSQLETFYQCKVCNQGYFLLNGICKQNPKEIIPNCKRYHFFDKCIECNNGYYLLNQNACLPVQPIDRCGIYDGSASTTVCKECEEFYYLKDYNNCNERLNEIEFCETYWVNKDGCQQCKFGYQVTNDNLKCISLIENCLNYFNSTYLDSQLQCQQCINEYYTVDGSTCDKGGIAFCSVYGPNQFKCIQCSNQYYLNSDGLCKPHSEIQHCQQYHPFFPDTCIQCDNLSFLFDVQNICTAITVTNCSVYLSPTQCSECNDGYQLVKNENQQQICVEFDQNLFPNCLRASLGVCIQCQNNFSLRLGKCYAPFQALLQNCETSNFDGKINETNFQCNLCKSGSIPFNQKNTFMCASNSKIKEITGQDPVSQNCVQYYQKSKGVYKCSLCSSGFHLQDDGTCLSSPDQCDPINDNYFYQYIRLQDDSVQFYWRDYCQPKTNQLCYKYGISSNQNQNNDVNYSCAQCRSNLNVIKKVNLRNEDHTLITGQGPEFSDSQQSYWKQEFECVDQQQQNSSLNLITQIDQNCEYYYLLHLNKYGCLRCRNGYKGTTVQFQIQKCQKYDDNKNCLGCIPAYYLENSQCVFKNTQDQAVNPSWIYGCDQHSFDQNKCYKCQDNFYLMTSDNGDTTNCLNRSQYPIQSCIAYNPQGEGCNLCEDNHTYVSGIQNCVQNISNCSTMLDATSCEDCDENYALNAGQCSLNNDPTNNCLIWEKNTSNCLYYKNIPFKKNYTCIQPELLLNCLNYDSTTMKCTKCISTHYLFTYEDGTLKCVLYNWHPDGTVVDPLNCKEYTLDAQDIICSQCKDGYHFETNNASDSICVQNNYLYVFYNQAEAITQTIQYAYITTDGDVSLLANCLFYDFRRKECVLCKANFYFYKLNCCADTFYGTNCTLQTSTFLTNCNKVLYNNETKSNECMECGGNTPVLSYGKCCATGAYYDKIDETCKTKVQNCSNWDEIFQYCNECDNGYYNHIEYNSCIQYLSYYEGDGIEIIANDYANSYNSYTKCDVMIGSIQRCLKCSDGYVLDKKRSNCIYLKDVYENCDQIDQDSKKCQKCSMNMYEPSNNNTYQTDVCCSYTLGEHFRYGNWDCFAGTIIPNCVDYNLVGNTCLKCSQGYYLDTVNNNCHPYTEFLDTGSTYLNLQEYRTNCAYFNLRKNSETLHTFLCDYCQANQSLFYAISNSGKKCCQQGYYFNNGSCVPLTVPNCLFSPDNTANSCQLCKPGYYINSGSCIEVQNSLNPVYQICKYPYYFNQNADPDSCVLSDTAATNLNIYLNDKWCVWNDISAIGVCSYCDENHHQQNTSTCCPNGTYFNGFRCVQQSISNCLIYSNTSTCSTCAQEDGFQISGPVGFIKNGTYSTFVKEIYTLWPELLTQKFQNYEKMCCKQGTYYNNYNKSCIKIPVENCYTYTLAEGCTVCQIGHTLINLANNSKICCSDKQHFDNYLGKCVYNNEGCTNGYYMNNGHCCQESKYWEENTQNCENIPMEDCIQAINRWECIKCANNYNLDTYGSYMINPFASNFSWGLKDYNYQIQFKPCIYYSGGNVQIETLSYNRFQLRNIVQNCQQFNKSKCEICETGYYLTSDAICCPLGQSSQKVGETYKCIKIDKLVSNCFDYDWKNKKCNKCMYDPQNTALQFHDQAGFCCQSQTFFNFNTMNCDISNSQLKCAQFDPLTGNCLKCITGTYLSQGQCCQEGFYSSNGNCIAMNLTVQNQCRIWLDAQICAKCNATESGVPLYIHRGRCVKQEYYVNNDFTVEKINLTGNVLDVGSFVTDYKKYYPKALANCLRLNDLLDCIQCSTGYSLQLGRCCPYGYIVQLSNIDGVDDGVDDIYDCVEIDDSQNNLHCQIYSGYPNDGQMETDVIAGTPITTIFECQTCDAGYYNTNKKNCCLPFYQTIENVINEEGYVDNGSYNHLNKYGCQNSKGNLGCLFFEDNSSCFLCRQGSYLLDSVCVINDLSSQALNDLCIEWENDGNTQICKFCKNGYKTKDATINGKTYKICDSTSQLANCTQFDNVDSLCITCKYGFKNNNGTSCDQVNNLPTNCVVNNATQCIQCEVGYIYDDTNNVCKYSIKKLRSAFCLYGYISAGGLICQRCISAHDLAINGTCTQKVFNNVDPFNLGVQILVGAPDTYPSYPIEGFYESSVFTCPYNFQNTLGQQNCVEIFPNRIEGCEEYEDSFKCKKCTSEYQLSNYYCCKQGQWWNGNNCVKHEGITTLSCNKFINGLLCDYNGCPTGYYVSSNKCCLDNKYFDITQNACVDIPLIAQPCKKRDQNKCLECVDSVNNYVSHGVCVRNNYYWDNQYQKEIDSNQSYSKFPKCKQVDNNVCVVCQTVKGDNSFSSNKCCTDVNTVNQTYRQYYDNSRMICVNLPKSLCQTFDYVNGVCTSCPSTPIPTYLVDSTKCCPLEQYWNGTQCVAINTLPINLYPFKDYCRQISVADLPLFKCTGCGDQKYKRGLLCCDRDDTFDVGNKCVLSDLMSNCQTLDENGSCTSCKTGYMLTGTERKLCCQNGYYFNETDGICKINPTSISQCQIYASSVLCSTCNSGFYSTQDQKKCCPVGTYYNGSICASQVTVQNCINFISENNCNKCLENHYLIKSENFQVCCPNQQYWDSVNLLCLPIISFSNNCLQMNEFRTTKYFLGCTKCDDGYYLSNNHCCPDNQQWDKTTKQCQAITTNCAQKSGGKCLKCKQPQTQYLTNYECCAFGTYWNGTACVQGLQTNKCKIYSTCDGIKCQPEQNGSVCDQCNDTFNLYDKKYCCAQKFYWNASTSVCLEYNEQNVGSNYHPSLDNCWYFTNDFKCITCRSDNISYRMSKYQDACCQQNRFVFINQNGKKECSQTVQIPTGCKIYDESVLECSECLDTHYFSFSTLNHENKVCCPLQQYYNDELNQCSPITELNFQQQCTKIDQSENTCIACIDGWSLNENNGKCYQIPNGCKSNSFNMQDGFCYDCLETHYLTVGICCPFGTFYRLGKCVSIDVNLNTKQCKTAFFDKCQSCYSTHYLSHNNCCLPGQYYFKGANDQGIPDCKNRSNTSHCAEFGFNEYECKKCDDGYVLSLLEDEYYDCIEITEKNNCKTFSLSEQNGFNYLNCNQCIATSQPDQAPYFVKIPAQDPTDIYKQAWNKNGCQNIEIRNILSLSIKQCIVTSSITCQPTQFINYLGQCENIPINNCLSYDLYSKICVQCENGFYLKYWYYKQILRSKCEMINISEFIHRPDHTLGYIDSCVLDQTLITQSVQNLTLGLDKFFNIHKCTNETEIPFAFVQAGGQTSFPTGISRYNLKAQLDQPFKHRNETPENDNNTFATDSSNLCMQPTLNLVVNKPTLGSLIENCAMAMINTDKSLSFDNNNIEISDLSQLSVFCVACKHGYKPYFNPRFPLHIYKCEKILNCNISQTQNFVNGCINCNENFTFGILNDDVDYTQCVSTQNNSNCLAIDSTNKCHFCKQGFTLNVANKCELITPYSCEDQSVSLYKDYSILDVAFINRHYDSSPGCKKCATGHAGLFIDYDLLVCTQSTLLNGNSNIYDANCSRFGENNKNVICAQCSNGFIRDSKGRCIQKSSFASLTNCLIAESVSDSSYRCQSCEDKFVNVNYSCQSPSIKGCQIYESVINNQQICEKCESGMYLQNNTCVQGSTQNCKEYNNSGICTQCIDKFALTNLKDNSIICVKVNLDPNCETYSNNQFQERNVKCLKCSANYLITNLSQPKTSCSNFEPIQGCKIHDQNQTLLNSSLKCIQCEDEYYLQDNQCKPRSFYQGCSTYDFYSNKCTLCLPEYYLTQSQNQCLPMPVGVLNCKEYISQTECRLCKPNFYLFSNQCLQVVEPIDGCEYYGDSVTCLSCSQPLILYDNQCWQKTVDCLTYINPNECESCASNLALYIENGLRICKQYEAIQNCLKHSNVAPVTCLVCNQDFYLNQNQCTQITETNKIEGCIKYSNENSCEICSSGRVLKIDKKKCVLKTFNNPTTNCTQLEEKEPFCVYCQPGYILGKDDNCVVDETYQQGCMTKTSDGQQCDLCMPGFFMNQRFECISY